jgi:hypothetical protein
MEGGVEVGSGGMVCGRVYCLFISTDVTSARSIWCALEAIVGAKVKLDSGHALSIVEPIILWPPTT